VGVLVFGAADAAAQAPAHSFAELSPSLEVGEYVYVADEQGILRMGIVASLTGAQLEMDGAGCPGAGGAAIIGAVLGVWLGDRIDNLIPTSIYAIANH
jgi:hypothetical protein